MLPASLSGFRWFVCVLLLLATAINYMDRQTLSSTASQVKKELRLNNEQYGDVETGFGYAFAAGALVFGVLADYVSIRWLYAFVLVAWSLVGIATGSAKDYDDLLFYRTLLGFFEAGHWPCALRTTQVLLVAKERTLGNSILQSGASIGAIATPIIVVLMSSELDPGSWRLPFRVIGGIGLAWAALWLVAMRGFNFTATGGNAEVEKLVERPLSWLSIIRRVIVLLIVVMTIQVCWQTYRAWLVLFLREGRGYSEFFAVIFSSVFYVATDVGCLIAGWSTVALARRGWSVGFSRWLVFACCALVTSLSVAVAYAPQGWLLLALLLLVGGGALGLFPCFYGLSQEVSRKHQGKLTGFLGFAAWMTSGVHQQFGIYADETRSFDLGILIAGCLPLIAVLAWLLIWDWTTDRTVSSPQGPATPAEG